MQPGFKWEGLPDNQATASEMRVKYSFFITLFFILGCGPTKMVEPRPLTGAYAHNDYAHKCPLYDALANGFCSVEADIHLIDGQLLVAHDGKDVLAGNTLERLYLDPLRERIRANEGHVYPAAGEFVLLIDVKSDARQTYTVLREVLKRYADILTVVRAGVVEKRAVQVIVSGNRPRQMMLEEQIRYAAFDGRLEDLASDEPVHFMPWISDKFDKVTEWQNARPMLPAERNKLRQIVAQAHSKGRKVRFWGTKDSPAIWRELLNDGVDIIGADDLIGLRRFLLEYRQSGK